MSNDFTKVLVQDDRLNVSDNIKYAVIKGGQSVTMSQFKALSETNSQLVFNIQVPSETTVIDRRVMLTTDLTLTVQSAKRNIVVAAPVGATYGQVTLGAEAATKCGYGTYAGLAPYPLHQLMTVASATINNNTVSINIRDVLPFIVRALQKGELNAYNGFSAVATDSYQSYTDSAFSQEGANCGGIQNLDTDLAGRGSIALLAYNYVGGANAGTETFTWRITEPLLLSPFLYCNPKSNAQGFYGIQNMNLVLNIGTPARAFRGLDGINGVDNTVVAAPAPFTPDIDNGVFVDTPSNKCYNSCAGNIFRTDGPVNVDSLPYIKSVALTSFANTYLYFVFLTPKPSQLMPSRNIVPYYELPRYITQVSLTSPSADFIVNKQQHAVYTSGLQADAGGTAIISQTLQLNQIPDKLVLFVRKPAAQQSYGDADVFLPIRGVSINFNNNSGILSSARSQDLYRMSKDNGSNQSWLEWTGQVSGSSRAINGMAVPASDAADWTMAQDFAVFPTSGSCLMLEFSKDIQLVEDYFAPGSLGNFNIQINLQVDNTMHWCNAPSSATNFELVMITMNSGVFVCERGTSSVYTGILTRADVLEASEQEAYGRSDIARMVGGGFMDWLKSSLGKALPILKTVGKDVLLPMAKGKLEQSGNPLAKASLGAMSALGLGRSGAGSSGGKLSGRYM